MLGKEFRSLAEAVTRTYGGDPWFFLRELAQNSRDAGAASIRVTAERSPSGLEILTFADDGRGMSLMHARRFLFRLYASDKDGDKTSAGKYGIGFWTILGFRPSQISLQSRCKKESWAVVLDTDLEVQASRSTLAGNGTVVRLMRPAVCSSAAEFSRTVEKALENYCRFLRRNDRRGTPLPVFFHDKNMTVAIRLPGPLSYSFHSGAVEGAVGLGEEPLVRLYARGLPVWEGALLSQMSHLQTHSTAQSELGQGLSPIFLLNGNRLDVTFSRHLVLENKALENVRKTAEKALQRLLANALETAFPRKWHQRGRDLLRALAGRVRRPGWLWLPLLLLAVLPLEIWLLSRLFPPRVQPATNFFDFNTEAIQYSGATVGKSFARWNADFAYAPPVHLWFKVFSAVDYDLQKGFVRRSAETTVPVIARPDCGSSGTVRMRFVAGAAGRVLLPLPPGHVIDPASLVFGARQQRLALSGNDLGEWSTEIPAGSGTVAYVSCPRDQEKDLAFFEKDRLTRLPAGLVLPPAQEKALTDAGRLTTAEKAARAHALVRSIMSYDTSEPIIRMYRRDAREGQWLARVLAIGKGDCDVINGVNVLLLRKMGVPARLSVGLIGSQGRILSGLHAWSEYFDNGWQVIDASADMSGTLLPQASPSSGLPQTSRAAPASSPVSGAGSHKLLVSLALALIFFALLLVSIFSLKRKSSGRKTSGVSAAGGRELILPIIQQALLRPEIWGRQSPLWYHRFLPTVDGKPMTIRRAFTLLRRGRLLYFTGPNPLVEAMRHSRVPILDLCQDYFAPLLVLIPGAINLNRIFQLQPQPLPGSGKTNGDLLSAVNARLTNGIRKPALCLLSPGLGEADFFHVSLPAAPRRKIIFFPQRFIAVNPAGEQWLALSALFEKKRPLAVFRVLHALHAESLLAVADPETFLKEAAQELLRGCP